MNLLDRLQSYVAGVNLPPLPPPKAPKGPQSAPGYRTTVKASTAVLVKKDRQTANLDRLAATRTQADTYSVVRELVATNPDVGGAVSFLLRTGIPDKFTVIGWDMDGKVSVDATKTAQALLRRVTFLGNPDGSYGNQQTLQSLSEQLSLELIMYGAGCLEVALDKQRVPASFNPIAIPTLRLFDEDNHFRLVQRVGGEDIDLDIPTVIYTSVDQFLSESYSRSYLETAIQPTLTDVQFTDDVRRALKRSVIPRLMAEIDSEAVKKFTPPSILNDPEKYAAYKNALITEVQNTVNGANPEDAFVSFNTVSYSILDGGLDPSTIIEKVQKVLNGKLSSGAKTLPVVLGHGTGSNASSTEAMLYVKQAGMLRAKLNEIYSRALTIAVRLMGIDGYVSFEYDPIDLRPTRELEAYKAMEQSRILEQLSIGLISDEEACLRLTGNLPPEGYTPKSGTMFRGQATTSNIANPASGTSVMDKTLDPSTPKEPKSQNKGK